MHVFETAYGDFGRADRELGHRADGSVTLEQVAPGVKDKVRYTYDLGDDWVHDIVVEKLLDPDPAMAHPRCTGGKRAAPPDDCGGIWVTRSWWRCWPTRRTRSTRSGWSG